jgi:hypothetical protein
VKVNVSKRGRRFQPFLHLAVTSLLVDADGQKIGRNMLVNFDAIRIATAKDIIREFKHVYPQVREI